MIPPASDQVRHVSTVRQIVGAAIVDSLESPTRLLVARRTAPPQFAGMWEFPGGKVEAGETCEEALRREVVEELGIHIRLGAEIDGPGPQGWPLHETAAMRVWFAEAVAGRPAPLQDHDELRWVALEPTEGLDSLPWIPADRPILPALRNGLLPAPLVPESVRIRTQP